MSEVAFHFNAPDKLAYACRFTRKAVRHEARLIISAPAAVLQRLDTLLWAMAPTDFVAHCSIDAPAAMQSASPVLLVPEESDLPLWRRHSDMLLQLGNTVPQGYAVFAKVIEIVSQSDTADRNHARARWRHYAAQGDTIVRHDLVLKA